MEIVYISGSYRNKTINGLYENIQKARKIALKYWMEGYAVICPHLNTAFMDGACDDHIWLEGDLEILKRCDIIVMMKEWRHSEGAWQEHDLAVLLNKEVIYE